MDERTFRNAMGKFATGVTVITTSVNGRIHGMTANAFMSVSLNPKLISVSIDERAQMLSKIKQSRKFAVSILSEDQMEVSKHFAGQLKEKRHFQFEWFNQLPVIPNALAHVICDVYNFYKAGDHTIFIGKVIDLKLRDGQPLTFFEGRYGLSLTNKAVSG
ncbi:flavin reductase family protein [Tuberibacillus calidus]|uniref:flavin reductase family protein n=1 Tax=Tuberibacillus calidus TaxID=340097 RepID=UPI00040C452E|nr:flavin reductase family protein [Tuberibacillus calidus]